MIRISNSFLFQNSCHIPSAMQRPPKRQKQAKKKMHTLFCWEAIASTHWYSSKVFPPTYPPWNIGLLTHIKLLCQLKRHFWLQIECKLDGRQILFINITNNIYQLLHFPKLFSILRTCCLPLNLALISSCWKLLPRVLPYSCMWQK